MVFTDLGGGMHPFRVLSGGGDRPHDWSSLAYVKKLTREEHGVRAVVSLEGTTKHDISVGDR